jgi:hypothetical protein
MKPTGDIAQKKKELSWLLLFHAMLGLPTFDP